MNGPGDRVRALAGAQLAFQMAFDVVAVFVVNNLCIAVVINNLESTRNEEQRRSDDWHDYLVTLRDHAKALGASVRSIEYSLFLDHQRVQRGPLYGAGR